jgi:hypothetical protein
VRPSAKCRSGAFPRGASPRRADAEGSKREHAHIGSCGRDRPHRRGVVRQEATAQLGLAGRYSALPLSYAIHVSR